MKLLFDPQRITDPLAWLAGRFGEVKVPGKAQQPRRSKVRARRRR